MWRKRENWLFGFAAIGAVAGLVKILEYFHVTLPAPLGTPPKPISDHGIFVWAIGAFVFSLGLSIYGFYVSNRRRKESSRAQAMASTSQATKKHGAVLFRPRLEDVGRRVESAFYGSVRKPPSDCTDTVRTLAVTGAKDIPVNHYKLCNGDDPDEGEDKFLIVTFSDTVRQSGRLELPYLWLNNGIDEKLDSLRGLEFGSWHASEGRIPTHWPTEIATPSWISIRNTLIAPSIAAKNVTVSLGFADSRRTQLFIVPETIWWEQQDVGRSGMTERWSRDVTIEGGEDQSCVLFVTDENRRVIPHKDAGWPLRPLDYDHWDVKVIVSSDNVVGFEGVLSFTQTRNSLAPDQPAFVKLRNVRPRLETIERFLR